MSFTPETIAAIGGAFGAIILGLRRICPKSNKSIVEQKILNLEDNMHRHFQDFKK